MDFTKRQRQQKYLGALRFQLATPWTQLVATKHREADVAFNNWNKVLSATIGLCTDVVAP